MKLLVHSNESKLYKLCDNHELISYAIENDKFALHNGNFRKSLSTYISTESQVSFNMTKVAVHHKWQLDKFAMLHSAKCLFSNAQGMFLLTLKNIPK